MRTFVLLTAAALAMSAQMVASAKAEDTTVIKKDNDAGQSTTVIKKRQDAPPQRERRLSAQNSNPANCI